MYKIILSRVGGDQGYRVRELEVESETAAMKESEGYVGNRERGISKKACIICPDGLKITWEAQG